MNGEPIPQLLLSVPEPARKNIDWLLAREVPVPCLERIQDVDSVHLASWMDTLLSERWNERQRIYTVCWTVPRGLERGILYPIDP